MSPPKKTQIQGEGKEGGGVFILTFLSYAASSADMPSFASFSSERYFSLY